MPKDRLDRVEKILDRVAKRLDNVAKRLDNVAKEQEEFTKEQKKTDEQIKELGKRQEKTDEQLKKTDEQIKELGKKQEKTDEQIKELGKKQEKTDEQLKKTDKEIDKVARDIGGGLGRAAEGLTSPCVPMLFKELGMKIEHVQQRVRVLEDGSVKAEVDLICPGRLNDKEIVLVGEVKAHLISEDIKEFLKDNLKNFKNYFPMYKEREIFGFVAGLNVDEEVARFAERQGLYVLAPAGETMKILNPKGFKPKIW